MTAESVIQLKKLILARLEGKAGPPLDVRSDERYPDWLVESYEKRLNAKQRSEFTQAVIELLQEEQVETISFNGDIKRELVALCRRLKIQEAEPLLLSLAKSINAQKEWTDVGSWDLMSEILSALAAIGTNRSEDLLRHLLTSSPNRHYRVGAFTALARINPKEAVKYLPPFEEVKTDAEKADFLAMLYGLVYGVGEEALNDVVDRIVRSFQISRKQGKFLKETLHRISKTKQYLDNRSKRWLDNINYLRIFRLRCWHSWKPQDIADGLQIQREEVDKKWFNLQRDFVTPVLIPFLIEKGILDANDPRLKKRQEENQ